VRGLLLEAHRRISSKVQRSNPQDREKIERRFEADTNRMAL